MGKVKSAVFTVLFTIVIAVLCAMCVVPTFTLPFNIGGSVKEYNSVLNVMSLDGELGGGYYTVYYPEGVISSSEYDAEYSAKKEVSDELANKYAEEYVKHGSLYLEKDVTENGDADEDFKAEFETAVKVIVERYAELDLDALKIDVVDDYAIRVEVSSAVANPDELFSLMSSNGDFTLNHSSKTLPLLRPTNNYGMDTYFEKVEVKMSGDTPFVHLRLTKEGLEKYKNVTAVVMADEEDTTLNFKVGVVTVVSLSVTEEATERDLYISGYSDELSAKAVAAVLNSCISSDTIELELYADDTNAALSVYGDKVATFAYIAMGVVLLGLCVFSAVRYKGVGVAYVYGLLSYAICAIMCVSLIEVINLSVAGVMAIMLGGIVFTFTNYYFYKRIKEEFEGGKRIASAVKDGYNKNYIPVIDVYAVLLVGALAMYLIGIGSVAMFGQIFGICALIAGLCSCVLTRFYFAMLMGNVKNQYKFCNFKREVIDDED